MQIAKLHNSAHLMCISMLCTILSTLDSETVPSFSNHNTETNF